MNLVRTYYYLTKPGLIYGNLLTVIAGYLYGAIMHPELDQLAGVTFGSWLVMASGTVINNVLDRDMDKHMKRTKKRALATGSVAPKKATIYAIILFVVGISILAVTTNTLTVTLGLIGVITYAGIYTYAKPRTVHATLLGTIPGATPLLAGYAAATGKIDVSFWVLGLIMVFWQMVHFYAIAIFRQKEYKAAKVPVITVASSISAAKILMTIFVSYYVLAILALAYFGYAGMFYLACMVPLSLWWLIVTMSGLRAEDDTAWSRKVFFISLLMLPALCIALGLNAWTP